MRRADEIAAAAAAYSAQGAETEATRTWLPVTGAEHARKMLDRSIAPNALIPTWTGS